MKFSGVIGFWNGDELRDEDDDVYINRIEERLATGDIKTDFRRFQSTESQTNENLVINNRISILADQYCLENWTSIRYVIWKGAKIKVTSVQVVYPRVILELGGAWNG